MAFTWTTPIGVGVEILDLALKEARDNCDYLDDNPSCLTHYTTHLTHHYGTYDASHYITNLGSDQSARCSSNYGRYWSSKTACASEGQPSPYN